LRLRRGGCRARWGRADSRRWGGRRGRGTLLKGGRGRGRADGPFLLCSALLTLTVVSLLLVDCCHRPSVPSRPSLRSKFSFSINANPIQFLDTTCLSPLPSSFSSKFPYSLHPLQTLCEPQYATDPTTNCPRGRYFTSVAEESSPACSALSRKEWLCAVTPSFRC
jgi:hypothetical protein